MINRIFSEKGYAIVVVLVVISALAVIALALSRQSRADITAVKYAVARIHAEAAARSGIRYVTGLLKSGSRQCLTAADCGVVLPKDQTLEKMFVDVRVDDSSAFTIAWADSDARLIPGVQDEAGRLNLNFAREDNKVLFLDLFKSQGITEPKAVEFARLLTQWVEPVTLGGTIVTRQDDRQSLAPRQPKHLPFESVEELALVAGLEDEAGLYQRLASEVTVFPLKPGPVSVNLNTADENVVRALAGFAAVNAGRGIQESQLLAERIIKFRKGPDGLYGTKDDRPFPVSMEELGTGGAGGYAEILTAMRGYQSQMLQNCRFVSRGVDIKTGVKFGIEVVLQVDNGAILAWNRI